MVLESSSWTVVIKTVLLLPTVGIYISSNRSSLLPNFILLLLFWAAQIISITLLFFILISNHSDEITSISTAQNFSNLSPSHSELSCRVTHELHTIDQRLRDLVCCAL